MATVRDFRRQNLGTMLAGMKPARGAQKRFAEETGLTPAYVSQLVQGFREMGDEVARRIEKAKGLNHGSLDLPPGPRQADGSDRFKPPSTSALNKALLIECIAGLEEGLGARRLAPDKKAEILIAIYELLSETSSKPNRSTILHFVRRAV